MIFGKFLQKELSPSSGVGNFEKTQNTTTLSPRLLYGHLDKMMKEIKRTMNTVIESSGNVYVKQHKIEEELEICKNKKIYVGTYIFDLKCQDVKLILTQCQPD